MNRRIVSVDGLDGSGKSYMGQRIVDAHGSARMLRVDDFRQPVGWGVGAMPDADLYYFDYYDLAALDRCMSAFLAGANSLEVPTYDSIAEAITGATEVDLRGVDLIVVEGVFTARMPTVANAELVWLDTSFEVATQRILGRDMLKGRTREQVLDRIEHRYFPAHRRYLAACDPITKATVVIDNNDYGAPRVDRLAADASELLTGLFT